MKRLFFRKIFQKSSKRLVFDI